MAPAIQPTTAGIITTNSGDRHIPESKRADGSTRKAIKIRPGYQPPEDVAKFRTKSQHQQENHSRVVPGAEGLQNKPDASAASNKNAKRKEARKKAKAAASGETEDTVADKTEEVAEPNPEPVDPNVEREKKARNLRKKLRQSRELKNKKDGGVALLPEQLEKVIKISQLIQELEALGFDTSDDRLSKETPEARQPDGCAAAPA